MIMENMGKIKTVILEPSTNTHVLEADNINKIELEGGGLLLEISGEGLVKHGEHATIKTEEAYVVKINQQEFNPITKMVQNAID
jgi:hypothetical protein